MTRFSMIAVIYIGTIFLLHAVSTSGIEGGTILGLLDASHLVHLAMFLPWALIGLPWINRSGTNWRFRALLWGSLGLVVAACAEGAQIWFPSRTVSEADLLANIAGMLLGFFAILPRMTTGRRPTC